MSKQATLTLVHIATPDWSMTDQRGNPTLVHHFTVERVTDSIEYLPGRDLSKDEVELLCKNSAWKIIIQKRK